MLTSITTEDYTSGTKITTTETIDYDQIGNPLTYRGATMSWFGRQLRTYSKGSTSANFVYDADGLRSAKAVNGTTTTYQYVGDQLFYEKIGENKILYYFYDSYGKLAAIYYTYKNGSNVSSARYHVATNAQGDVIALYNSNGVKVGAYDYDAWGNQRVFVVTQNAAGANVHTQINPETEYLNHIVNVNPIRYRGYYYDKDLGLYYLQSRYYDSDVGRFINADEIDVLSFSPNSITDKNLFAYCDNNPVIRADDGGTAWHIVAGALIGGAGELVGQLLSGTSIKDINWTKVGIATLSGGLTAACGPVLGAAISGATNVAMDLIDGERNPVELTKSFAIGATISAIGSGVGSGCKKNAINNLSKMSKREVKSVSTKLYPEIKGVTRNKAKSVSYMVNKYNDFGERLVGKTKLTVMGQVTESFLGWLTLRW